MKTVYLEILPFLKKLCKHKADNHSITIISKKLQLTAQFAAARDKLPPPVEGNSRSVVYLSKEECSFRGHDETSESDNEGNFKELIDFLKTYDQKLVRFLSEATVFVGTSKSIQNDLIESISSVVEHEIQEELRSMAFFSWQIDETTYIACKSQLSVILRYVIGGDIVERFVGFYDVSSGKNAESLYQLLVTEFQEFDLKHKLIAQTYDGAAVMSGDFNGLQPKIKNIAPHALFTHCYAHKLNLMLSKACNAIKEVRKFFSNLSGKRSEALNRIVDRRIPTNAPTRWNFLSRAVVTVESQRRKLIEVFEFISESEDFFNDNQTLREAYVTSASVERSFSALKRIKTYNRSKMTQDRLTALSLITIEKYLVSELKETDNFYDNVIDYFANSKNRRLPLLYKNL
nr:unnamed protein product [Callosobruchus analis]